MQILIVQGHPDASAPHFCHALAAAFAEGARGAGHGVETIDLGRTEVPLLRSETEWKEGPLPPCAVEGQAAVLRADLVVLVFPLWMGGMPALLKAWIEQVFRDDLVKHDGPQGPERRLKGKAAQLIVTMGMPAPVYRWYFGAAGTRQLSRGILGFSGMGPIGQTLIGMVDGISDEKRARWLERMRAAGAAAGRG